MSSEQDKNLKQITFGRIDGTLMPDNFSWLISSLLSNTYPDGE